MAKLTRKTSKLFGSGAVAGPNGIGEFGSLAGGTPAYSLDPAIIQALGSWAAGWIGAWVQNFPALEDENSTDFVHSYNDNYIYQTGIPEYDSGTTYFTNSFCSYGTLIYISLADNNTGNQPDTHPASWAVYGQASFYGVATIGAADHYTSTITGLTALKQGMVFNLLVSGTATDTSPDLNINGLGAYPITDAHLTFGVNGMETIWNDGQVVTVVWDGTHFVVPGTNVWFSNTVYAGAAGGTANAITLTNPAYIFPFGTAFEFIAANDNTGATTLKPGGFGVLPLLKKDGTAMSGGEIVTGTLYRALFVNVGGGSFQIIA